LFPAHDEGVHYKIKFVDGFLQFLSHIKLAATILLKYFCESGVKTPMTLKLLYFQDKTFVQAGKYFIQIYQI
jgi:hypothetical protein